MGESKKQPPSYGRLSWKMGNKKYYKPGLGRWGLVTCSLSCTRFVIRANKLRLGHNDLTTFTPLNQELNAIQLVFPIEMNFLVRSVLLFDLPFVSFLVSFALTLCLSITHTHTVPDSCVCQYSVLVLVSFSPTLRRSLREDRRPDLDTIFIFMCLHHNPRYRCFFLFHPLRTISFKSFSGLRTTQSSSNIVVVILTQTPGQHYRRLADPTCVILSYLSTNIWRLIQGIWFIHPIILDKRLEEHVSNFFNLLSTNWRGELEMKWK